MRLQKICKDGFILLTAIALFTGCGGGDEDNTAPVDNTPPVANTQNIIANEDTNTTITLTGSDADGDTLTYDIINFPAHGTLSGGTPDVIYRPDSNYNGSDNFTFIVNDGTVDSAATTVSISITAINRAPVAESSILILPEMVATSGILSGSDANGDSLTFSIVTNPTKGSVTITNPATGAYTYTPSSIGDDSFTFTVNDGTVEGAEATVSISYDAPAAPTNTAAINGDRRVTLSWDAMWSADSYNVYWSTTSGTGIAGTKITGASTPFYHDGLTNGTGYYYVVTAVNAAGESNASDETMSTPIDIPITDLTFADANLSTCINTAATNAGTTYVHELTSLDCSYNSISDISGIEQLTSLSELQLYSNTISDITPLAALSNLSWLYLDANNISDVSPLATLSSLLVLDIYTNNISDVSPLTALTGLAELDLSENAISDVSPLTTLTNLTYLGLDNNTITDVSPLATLTSLTELYLYSNTIGGENVGNVDDLGTLTAAGIIDLSDNPNISCIELNALIAVLGADVVDSIDALGNTTCTP